MFQKPLLGRRVLQAATMDTPRVAGLVGVGVVLGALAVMVVMAGPTAVQQTNTRHNTRKYS